jgi:two-component system chemotaxis response regulator CheY
MAPKRKPRILLAEDEPHSRVLMKAVLASLNCDVIGEAKTGVEAVELYKKLKPDLMLLDVNMPLKTGDEVLKEILSYFPKAFIIILTSVSDVGTITECLSLGAANYIRKDTPIAEIKAIIKETWSTFAQNQRSCP